MYSYPVLQFLIPSAMGEGTQVRDCSGQKFQEIKHCRKLENNFKIKLAKMSPAFVQFTESH